MIENLAFVACISNKYIIAQPKAQSIANLSFASSRDSSSISPIKAIKMKEGYKRYVICPPKETV